MGRMCAVRFCKTNSKGILAVHMYPMDAPCRCKWKEFMSKCCASSRLKMTTSHGICSLHFERHCFLNLKQYLMGLASRLYLHKGAYPTIEDGGTNQIFWENVDVAEDRNEMEAVHHVLSRTELETIPCSLQNRQMSLSSSSNNLHLQPSLVDVPALVSGIGGVTSYGSQFKMTARRVHIKRFSKSSWGGSATTSSTEAPMTSARLSHTRIISPTSSTSRACAARTPSIVDKILAMMPSSSALNEADPEGLHCREAMEEMYSMQRKGKCCDLTLCVTANNGKSVRMGVHRSIFEVKSKKIEELDSDTMVIMHSSWPAVCRVVEFVYTGKIEKAQSFGAPKVRRVCVAAHLIGVEQCVEYFRKMFPGQNLSDHHLSNVLCLKFCQDRSRALECNDDTSGSLANPPTTAMENGDLMPDNNEFDLEKGDIDNVHVERDTTDTSADEG